MSTKWSTEVLGTKAGTPDFGALLKDEHKILLLRGKNVFGDFVFCYLKIPIPDVKKLEAAISGEGNFNIHDFGTVLAAGKGEPSAEVQAEIAANYPVIGKPEDVPSETASAPAPAEKKNWDEY